MAVSINDDDLKLTVLNGYYDCKLITILSHVEVILIVVNLSRRKENN